MKKLFRLYNEQGLTSIADRNASREALDLYRDLHRASELTVRVNVARSFDPYGTREQIAKRLDALPGKDGRGGPTGAGDDWVRIGPIKLFLDGGMLNGTAYMRQPWPQGDTYQITEDDYRGLLFIPPEQLTMVVEEGGQAQVADDRPHRRRGGHGRAARRLRVRQPHDADQGRCASASRTPTFPRSATWNAARNWASAPTCSRPGCTRTAPRWPACWARNASAGSSRTRPGWNTPSSAAAATTCCASISLTSTNPWDPWLGIWVALTRKTEGNGVLVPAECLTREQALRLYTINNAYLHHEEKSKGSLEVGKLADLILIDRDILTCPVDDVRHTRVLLTVVDGKVVYRGKVDG